MSRLLRTALVAALAMRRSARLPAAVRRGGVGDRLLRVAVGQ